MKRKRLVLLVATLVVVASALSWSGMMGASAEADGGEQSFRWLAGAGMFEAGFLCGGGGPPCPGAATSHPGPHEATIEVTGEGVLSVEGDDEDFEPEDVSGGGSFRIRHGDIVRVGTWTAKELVSFVSFGASPCVTGVEAEGEGCKDNAFPFPTAHAGLAVIEVEGVVDGTGNKFDAILTVGCELPGVPDAGLEGIRFEVLGGLNFSEEPPLLNGTTLRSTLFIDLGGDGDD